jgi:curli production assembly/transport component CsgG
MNIGGKLGFKYFLTPNFNVEVNGNYFTLENENIVKRNYYGPEVNLEYSLFPKYSSVHTFTEEQGIVF